MVQKGTQSRWHINWLRPHLFGNKHAIRPPEISDGLCRVITDPKNSLEDANYKKVAPNLFVVEISPQSYKHHFEPLGSDLVQQWRDRLVEHIQTTNSRLGRKEYRLSGPIQIELISVPGMADNQARILCRVNTEPVSPEEATPAASAGSRREVAILESVDGGRRWPLFPGENTIGRDETCDIFMDSPMVQDKRLVSAQHATIRVQDGKCFLFDGDPGGKPSRNGTYVNSERVPGHGTHLRDGDLVILAALDPSNPRLDTPGVAAFRFRKPPRTASLP